jgi:hypothetical protein
MVIEASTLTSSISRNSPFICLDHCTIKYNFSDSRSSLNVISRCSAQKDKIVSSTALVARIQIVFEQSTSAKFVDIGILLEGSVSGKLCIMFLGSKTYRYQGGAVRTDGVQKLSS